MGIAAIGGRCGPGDRANRDDLAGTLLLHNRRNGVARVHGPEQVHLCDKLQERRIEGAGFGVHGPTATASRIRDQHVNTTPLLDHPRDHRLDRLVVTDIDFDPQSGPA
jgi:hypothetical protein